MSKAFASKFVCCGLELKVGNGILMVIYAIFNKYTVISEKHKLYNQKAIICHFEFSPLIRL